MRKLGELDPRNEQFRGFEPREPGVLFYISVVVLLALPYAILHLAHPYW